MKLRKVINRRIRRSGDGVDVVGDVNAVISANVGERGSHSTVSSSQRIVQRSGRTEVTESHSTSPPHRPQE